MDIHIDVFTKVKANWSFSLLNSFLIYILHISLGTLEGVLRNLSISSSKSKFPSIFSHRNKIKINYCCWMCYAHKFLHFMNPIPNKLIFHCILAVRNYKNATCWENWRGNCSLVWFVSTTKIVGNKVTVPAHLHTGITKYIIINYPLSHLLVCSS